MQKQVRQGSQGIVELIDLFGHQGRKTEAETQYNDAYARLKKIFGKKEQPTFKSCKLPLGYLLTISRVATQGVRNKHKQARQQGVGRN